jgi:hypothetical protein
MIIINQRSLRFKESDPLDSADVEGGEEEEELPAWLLPQSPMDKIFRQSFGNVGQQELEEVDGDFQRDEDKTQEQELKNTDEEDREEEITNNVSSELFPSSSPPGRTGPRPRSAKGRLRTTGRAAGDLFPNREDRTELSNFLLDRGAKDEDNGNTNGDGVDRVGSMSVSRTPSPSPSPSPFPSPNKSLNASAFEASPQRRKKIVSPQRSAQKQPINHDKEFRVSDQHASEDVIISKSLQEAINKSVEMSFKNLLENISLKNLLLQGTVKAKKGDHLKKKKLAPSVSSSAKISIGSTKTLKPEKRSSIPYKNNIHEYISESEGNEGNSAIRSRIRKMRQQILSNERNKEIHHNISENVLRSNSQSFNRIGMAAPSVSYRNSGSINTTNSKIKGIKLMSGVVGSSQPKGEKEKPVKKGKRNP